MPGVPETWLGILAVISIPILVGLVAWLWVQTFATKRDMQRDLGDYKDRLAFAEKSIAVLEARIESMPSREDLRRIHERMDGFVTKLGSIEVSAAQTAATMELMNGTVSRLHDAHMGDGS